MDKKLSESELMLEPARVMVKLTKSNLPGDENSFYRGTLPLRYTLNIEDIAERTVKSRTSYRRETLIEVYRMMTEEIYSAIEKGWNVDFGLARTDLVVSGRFDSPYDKFDRKRHALQMRFRPSPRLNQLANRIPARVETGLFGNGPAVTSVGILYDPSTRSKDDPLPYNCWPTGYDMPVFVYGRHLKLAGDTPEVGITLRCMESGEDCFIASRRAFINEAGVLGFQCPLSLTPGEWEITIVTQHTPSYHLYKTPRMAVHALTVVDCPLPG
jgi:DNA-binding domain/Domain of unknown function (DUF4469) with IG-like fold